MKFRTEIGRVNAPFKIGYEDQILMLGSCFTDQVGSLLKDYLFHVRINPFGVIYNPMSVLNGLNAFLAKEEYTIEDLKQHNELWFSFDHYTKFSDPDPEVALAKINESFHNAKKLLGSNTLLILTFGSAWVYTLKEGGRVVNNCHKLPAENFHRRLLEVDEIVDNYRKMITRIGEIYPGCRIMFTISPVRHIRDGLTGNQQSKATLILAIRKLLELFPAQCNYFPSYEIVIDDLRDYRFYQGDLVHPNDQAVQYIWEIFRDQMVQGESNLIIDELEPLLKSIKHRPLQTGTSAYDTFVRNRTETEGKLKEKFPFLNWSENDRFID